VREPGAAAQLAVLEARSQGWARALPSAVKGRSRSAPRGGLGRLTVAATAAARAAAAARRPAPVLEMLPKPHSNRTASVHAPEEPAERAAAGRARQRTAPRAPRAQSTDSRASDASSAGRWAAAEAGARGGRGASSERAGRAAQRDASSAAAAATPAGQRRHAQARARAAPLTVLCSHAALPAIPALCRACARYPPARMQESGARGTGQAHCMSAR